MPTRLLLLACCLAFALVASAQAPMRTVRWKPNDPCCQSVQSKGDTYLIIKDAGFNVSMTVGKFGDYYAAEFFIFNQTGGKTFAVEPRQAGVLYTGKGRAIVKPTDPERVPSSVESRVHLRRVTLQPGQEAHGMLFFERRPATSAVLSFKIEGTVYEFPFKVE